MTDVLPPRHDAGALLSLAAALEQRSEHPLARAVIMRAEEDGLTAAPVGDFRALPGNGLTATLSGETLLGGSLSFVSRRSMCPAHPPKGRGARGGGQNAPALRAGRSSGGRDRRRRRHQADSPAAIAALRNMGIRVVMLTGDNEKTARAIGRLAGVDEVIAGVLPEGKESVIRRLQAQGKVAMVGDGINDAPALTRADIGVAIGAGTDVAIDAADVVLMKSRLSDVPAAIRLSRATLRNIHENLFWAFFYNVIGIPLAAGVDSPSAGRSTPCSARRR